MISDHTWPSHEIYHTSTLTSLIGTHNTVDTPHTHTHTRHRETPNRSSIMAQVPLMYMTHPRFVARRPKWSNGAATASFVTDWCERCRSGARKECRKGWLNQVAQKEARRAHRGPHEMPHEHIVGR